MSLYQNILNLQSEYGLGAVDFIDKTGFSNGMYYDIKRGKKTKLSPVQLKKLKDLFPDYDFSLFDIKNGIKRNPETTKSELTDHELKELAYNVIMNEEALMKIKAFSNIIEIRVAKRLQKIMSSEEEYIKWRNS